MLARRTASGLRRFSEARVGHTVLRVGRYLYYFRHCAAPTAINFYNRFINNSVTSKLVSAGSACILILYTTNIIKNNIILLLLCTYHIRIHTQTVNAAVALLLVGAAVRLRFRRAGYGNTHSGGRSEEYRKSSTPRTHIKNTLRRRTALNLVSWTVVKSQVISYKIL